MGKLRHHAIAVLACAAVALSTVAAAGQVVEIEVSKTFGEIQLVNRGAAIQLSSEVKVEQMVDGKWQQTPVANLYLISSCTQSPAPACVLLAANASLRPVPWRGNYCSSQCMANCNLDGPVPPGTYRYVVTSCDRKRRFYSAAFEKKAQAAQDLSLPRK